MLYFEDNELEDLVTKNYAPLNDYVLVEVAEDPSSKGEPGQMVDPEADETREAQQVGRIYHAGHFDESGVTDHQIPLEVGEEVYWVRFSGSGRTTEIDGKQIAQIPYDRLTMVAREVQS